MTKGKGHRKNIGGLCERVNGEREGCENWLVVARRHTSVESYYSNTQTCIDIFGPTSRIRARQTGRQTETGDSMDDIEG